MEKIEINGDVYVKESSIPAAPPIGDNELAMHGADRDEYTRIGEMIPEIKLVPIEMILFPPAVTPATQYGSSLFLLR